MTENEASIRYDFIRCALLGGTKPEIIPNEDNVELMDMAIKALEEVQQYRTIGTVEECREAVEKMKPKKIVKWANGTEHCPTCDFDNSCIGYGFCIDCGQKLDWSGEE